jgi:TRAP-type C4-dicarboxylate transport system permease small subunit
MLERAARLIEQVVNKVAIILFSVVFVTMLLQIFFRYVLDSPLVWTEELCRYLFIWTCFLGWTIALRQKSHIRISFFIERLPPSLAKGVTFVFQILIFVFLIQLFRYGIAMTMRSFSVPTITLFFSWAYVYLAVPLSAAIMLLYSVVDVIDFFREGSCNSVKGEE